MEKDDIMNIQHKYGYSVGDIVENKVEMVDELGVKAPPGTPMKIVAIAPKVSYTNPYLIKQYPHLYDTKEYFVNLIRVTGTVSRFRENFVTISKPKDIITANFCNKCYYCYMLLS